MEGLLMSEPVRSLTRDELFDLVWSKPSDEIAVELGTSEHDLRRLCSRHQIPCPSRAYWSRVASGQHFTRPLLRRLENVALDKIEIALTTSTAVLAPTEDANPQGEEPSKLTTDRIVMRPSSSPESLHIAVGATAKALRKAKPDENGRVSAVGSGLCGLIVHAERVERALNFVDALASALDEEGWSLQPDAQRMKIEVGMDTVTFTLTEKTRRQKHIPTASEQAAYNQRKARRQRAADRQDWELYASLPYEKPWPEYDTIYTGQLALVIDGWHQGLRKTWADGKTQRIDTMLENVVTGLKAVVASDQEERERREERERQWAELSRRRDLAKKRKEREEARIAHLRELVQLQREAADIKEWLGSLPPEAVADNATELGRMVVWAQARLTALQAKTTVDGAAVKLEGKALFPDVDELHDPLGDPPEPKYHY